jgi:hypothetical protein
MFALTDKRPMRTNRYTSKNHDHSLVVTKRRKSSKRSVKKRRSPRIRELKVNKNLSGPRAYCFKCSFPGCSNTNNTTDVKWYKVPRSPSFPKTDRLKQVRNYYMKKKRRFVILDRLGLDAKNQKNPRWCSAQEFQNVLKKPISFKYKEKSYFEKISIFPVPVSVGNKANPVATVTPSKGIGIDRYNTSFLNSLDDTDKLGIHLGNKSYSPKRAKTYDYRGVYRNTSTFAPERLEFDSAPAVRTVSITASKQIDREPYVKPGMVASEIKRRTGFNSEEMLLAFVAVVCNGDASIIKESFSTLTWYEEWFLYFEVVWGRTLRRWEDVCSKDHYGLCSKQARILFDRRVLQVLQCRESWPIYATYIEDQCFCNQRWKSKYNEMRVIMWDDTNVNLNYKPSTAHNQRLTYSSYYGRNCAKGGVHLQFCGWLGVYDLWTGGVSDSEYLKYDGTESNKGILWRQKEFQNKDLVNGIVKEFHNILDKGYRVIQAIYRYFQKAIQPIFSTMGFGFKGIEGLCIAEVASDRSGNERAVKCVKQSNFITDGLHSNQSFSRMNNVWKAFAFQCNFMFQPVL